MAPVRAALPLLLSLILVVAAACGGGPASPTPARTGGSDAPPPTTVPGDAGGGTGGGLPGNGDGSGGGSGGGGGVDPGGANLVIPKPGTRNPAAVQIAGLAVTVDGRLVTAQITWWSGVEPCYVFDSTHVARDGNTVTITALEGSGDAGVACIEIAQLKTAILDLGEFEPGTYVIAVNPGDAPPITIEVR